MDLTPAASINSQSSSSISFFFLTISSPVIGCFISWEGNLPKILSDKLTKTLPPSIISVNVIDDLELQSFVVIWRSLI